MTVLFLLEWPPNTSMYILKRRGMKRYDVYKSCVPEQHKSPPHHTSTDSACMKARNVINSTR